MSLIRGEALKEVVLFTVVEAPIECLDPRNAIMTEDTLRARDWAFLAEGGQHVICRHRSDDDSVLAAYYGSVLRIRKRGEGDSGQAELAFIEGYEASVNGVLYPSSSSLQSSKVMLDSTFIDELSSAIQASRPARYQSSIIDGPVIGEVMPNAFKLYKEPRDHSHDLTDIPSPVSLEIKVKGGHPSVSPFLAPTSIKRQYGRHHLKELAGLGDSAEFEAALSHRPTDLGSRDYDVIKKCLSDLVQRPKKVLRCYLRGEPALGSFSHFGMRWSDTNKEGGSWSTLCGRALPGHPEAEEIILSAVASALSHDDTAHCLLNAQKFDLIDIEGAGMIYDRLVFLLGDKGADASLARGAVDMAPLLGQLAQYFYAVSGQGQETVDEIRGGLPQALQKLLTSEVNVTTFCAELSEQESVMLLNLWLIALAAKDASLIVSLQCTNQEPSEVSKSGGARNVEDHVSQTEDHCGLVVLGCPGSTCHVNVSYTVALVDIGYKGTAKCWNKQSEEERFCELAAKGAKGS